MASLMLKRHAAATPEAFPEEIVKRRRVVTAAEVEQGLEEAGLFQPALAALRGTKRSLSSSCGQPSQVPQIECVKRACRQAEASGSSSSSGRKRICTKRSEQSERVPLWRDPALRHDPWVSSAFVEANLNQALVPTTPLKIMKPPHRIAVDPAGIAFIVSEQGFLLAELPSCWRPTVSVGHRVVALAKVAIDAKGTAYLFGADGELLTTIQAVRCLQDSNSIDNLKIQLVGSERDERNLYLGMQGSKVVIEEESGDSTDVPPSPEDDGDDMEDGVDLDADLADSMEWESI
mmetsp:Transcript_20849/g.48329  ORF Transcript_20849/g.48329 Transcript_20849/m.48329 type:complete len:290 (-) Transcript_20849:50-919(-)